MKLWKLFLALLVALVATPTMAEEAKIDCANLAGSKEPMVLQAAATPEQVADFQKKSGYPAASCSVQEIAGFYVKLGWKAGQPIPKGSAIPIPLPASEPVVAASAEKPAMTMVSNPVVQSLPAAKPVETPELKAARSELASTKTELATKRAEQKRLEGVSASRGGAPGTMLTAAEKAAYDKVVADVAALSARVATLESAVNSLISFAKSTNQWNAKQDKGIAAADAKAAEALQKAKEAKAAAEAAGGLPWWGWALIALSLILGMLGTWVFFFRKTPNVKQAVADALAVDGLSHTTIKADVAELRQQLEELSTDVADGAKDRKQIELPTDLVDSLKALAIGESIDVSIGVNGKRGLIGFTKHNDTQVMAHDIDKQTQAMNIDGICKTINRAIGGGRVKMRPIATAAVA